MTINKPVVAMMMAMDRNRLIGSEGQMPWHIPGELAYFKSVTMGKPIIMGRKTFESIGKPLPGRTNVVVTRNLDWSAEGVLRAHTLEQALSLAAEADQASPEPELMIIGGAALCADAMPQTQRLYLTTIDHAFDGDTWLDSFHWEDWRVVTEDVRDPATTGGLAVTYWVLEKA
ncbi:dihydrofolate reductase [Granulosicoccus sp. 3-233]|uniref:dihydrofolate reductase n=1 Tax=Granulosicoccus sp. 3-233 TaxID=3417969 RepID=UPI003D343981